MDGRVEAVRWKLAMENHIADRGYRIGALVPFSWGVNDKESGADGFTDNSPATDPNLVFNLRSKLDAAGHYDGFEADRVVAVETKPGAKQSELVASIEPVIRADVIQLQRAVANLIGNALEYTADGGRIWIRAASDGERVEIEVGDSGGGIVPGEQAWIWERLYRVDKSRSQRGLGLSFVKAIVEAHGAHVSNPDGTLRSGAQNLLPCSVISPAERHCSEARFFWLPGPFPYTTLRGSLPLETGR